MLSITSPRLSKERIVATAIDLLNAGGLSAASMRAIASRLGVKAASLYGHISGKDELLAEIAEVVAKNCLWDPMEGEPEHLLMELMFRYRRSLKAIRDAVTVMQVTPPTTPIRRSVIQRVQDLIRQLGVKEEDVFISGHLLNNYVLSFVDDEERMAGSGRNLDEEFQKGLHIILAGIRYWRAAPIPSGAGPWGEDGNKGGREGGT